VDDWFVVSNAIVEALGLKEKLARYTTLEKFGLREYRQLFWKKRVMGGFFYCLSDAESRISASILQDLLPPTFHFILHYALRIKRETSSRRC
jgi:hypothetical protein